MSVITLVATLAVTCDSASLRSTKKVHHGMTHSIAHAAASFSNYSSAMSYLNNQPAEEGCMPICKWTCETPTCAQTCEPKCDAPKCESRCSMDTSSCAFNCQEPSCALVCPEAPCANKDPCPKCQAVCGEPVCTLDCPGSQPCSTVCEEPQCSYECKKPDSCPEPKCNLECDKPKACQDFQVAKELPPARAGETTVVSFDTSGEILKAGTAPKLHEIPAGSCPPGCVAGSFLLQLDSRNPVPVANTIVPHNACPTGCFPVRSSAPIPVHAPMMTVVKNPSPAPAQNQNLAPAPAKAAVNKSMATAAKSPAANAPAAGTEKKAANATAKKHPASAAVKNATASPKKTDNKPSKK
eukprot:gnl/MRDRNA2_/MRDRNA2_95030_c0_seq1.p1 gnl/MRDRNA2_/MRDRNA2_95030_c0~~gnl/MRDRNA2_/MRDRNA2_95030_c0_seq1.p1  ORF type:complete len:353 (+),score=70.94 gnl/MRDRNA2_/MRDRNA2_95030_c0_seq1:97-1155(+)